MRADARFSRFPGSLPLRNRLCRLLWGIVWSCLYRPTPRPMHAWRCWLLRLFGARLGKRVHPYPSSRVWAPWNLEMADDSCLGENVDCYCVDKIVIGEKSLISQYSFLCSASHDHDDPTMPLITAPIIIGRNVWVAADAYVGPGVTIGESALVGARSSVFRDVPAQAIVGGNPARVIGQRLAR